MKDKRGSQPAHLKYLQATVITEESNSDPGFQDTLAADICGVVCNLTKARDTTAQLIYRKPFRSTPV